MILQLRRLGLYQAPGPTVQPSWRYLPHCLAAALLLRLGLNLFSDFISFTDEIWHYQEQGHRLAFGYSITIWEWHWGARSYLLPGIIAGLLLPFKWLGIDHPAHYVPFVEAFFCVFSLLIPWGLYHFTRHQHGETAARIALLLGVVSFYLLAFAAKTLTETVAGAVLAAALGMAGRPFIRGDAGAWLFGFLLGVATCLRYLYLPALGILWLAVALAMPARWSLRSIGGGLLAIIAYGLLDHLTWGRPFNSIYMHMLWNLDSPEGFRSGDGEIFYPQRLLFISAGCVLLTIIAWLRYPRSHLLTLLMTLAILLPHMLASHKEFRFVAPLFFLWMPAAAWMLSDWSRRRLHRYRHDLARGLIAVQLLFGMLVASGTVNDYWIYKSGLKDKDNDELGYFNNSPDFFAGIAWLREQDDVEGILFGTHNFNYYYLHRDIPIYDMMKFDHATKQNPGKKLVSHVLTYNLISSPSLRLVKTIGHAKIYEDVTAGPVYAEDYSPEHAEDPNWQHSAKILPPPVER